VGAEIVGKHTTQLNRTFHRLTYVETRRRRLTDRSRVTRGWGNRLTRMIVRHFVMLVYDGLKVSTGGDGARQRTCSISLNNSAAWMGFAT